LATGARIGPARTRVTRPGHARPGPCVLALSLALAGCAAGQPSPSPISIAALLANPAGFSGSFVTLTGRTTSMASRVTAEGLPLSSFFLDDGTGIIPIVATGPPVCEPGRAVLVEGFFRAQDVLAQRPVRPSRVDAVSVRCS
jgi:hypothetical protein